MSINPELSNFLSLLLELKSLVKFHPLWEYIISIRLDESILLRYKSNSYLFKIIKKDNLNIFYSVKIYINYIMNENSKEFNMSISYLDDKIEISQYYINPLEEEEEEKEDDEYISRLWNDSNEKKVELEYWN